MRETLQLRLLLITILYKENQGFTNDKRATKFTVDKKMIMARLIGRLCYEKRCCDHKEELRTNLEEKFCPVSTAENKLPNFLLKTILGILL